METQDLILAIDNGTTSSRAVLYNVRTGKVEAECQKEIKQYYPNSGWMEENPDDIIESVVACINTAVNDVEAKGYKITNIKCAGLTNQRETTVVWDKMTGKPLCNAIIWCDTRTTDLVKHFTEKAPNKNANAFTNIVGLPISTYFSALKLCWLLKEVNEVKKAVKEQRLLFGTVDTWLIWKLTKGEKHVTDVTNASRTMLMNLNTLDWDNEMCKFFEIDKSILPKILSSASNFGLMKIFEKSGLSNIEITGVLGDQQASLVGQGCTKVGDSKCTFGTGAFLLKNIGQKPQFSTTGLLTTVAYQFSNDRNSAFYALEGSIPVASGAVNWLRDNLGIMSNVRKELEPLVTSCQTSGGCYFVPAFNGLFCPWWQPKARGIITGLSQTIQKAHICRATLEAIAFQCRTILLATDPLANNATNTKINLKSLKVDGGLTSSKVFCEILADLCEIEINKPESVEASVLGAAIAAGHGKKINVDGLTNHKITKFNPTMKNDKVTTMYNEWLAVVKKTFS